MTGKKKKKKNETESSRASRKNSESSEYRERENARMSMSVDEVRVYKIVLYTFSHLGPLLAFYVANVRPIAAKQRCGHTQPPFQAFENWFSILFSTLSHTIRRVCARLSTDVASLGSAIAADSDVFFFSITHKLSLSLTLCIAGLFAFVHTI